MFRIFFYYSRAEIGDLSFRVGSTHESKDGQVIKVAKVIQNPNYKIFKLDYDFVLLELEKSLTYSDQIQPIQLPNEDIDIPDGTVFNFRLFYEHSRLLKMFFFSCYRHYCTRYWLG